MKIEDLNSVSEHRKMVLPNSVLNNTEFYFDMINNGQKITDIDNCPLLFSFVNNELRFVIIENNALLCCVILHQNLKWQDKNVWFIKRMEKDLNTKKTNLIFKTIQSIFLKFPHLKLLSDTEMSASAEFVFKSFQGKPGLKLNIFDNKTGVLHDINSIGKELQDKEILILPEDDKGHHDIGTEENPFGFRFFYCVERN